MRVAPWGSLVIAIATTCSVVVRSEPVQPKNESTGLKQYELPEPVLRSKKLKALAGDIGEAFDLVKYYDLQGPREVEEYWIQIAAENGSAQGSRWFANLLAVRGERYHQINDCHRAQFWSLRSAQLQPRPTNSQVRRDADSVFDLNKAIQLCFDANSR
jgi:hypothetical protein